MPFQKRIRIKEVCLEIKDEYESIPFASVVRFTENNSFKPKFFSFGYENSCINGVFSIFNTSILNLVLSKQIEVVYFIDDYSSFFGLYQTKIQGYILKAKVKSTNEFDPFSDEILFCLNNMQKNQGENLTRLIRNITENYFNSYSINQAELTFIEKYLHLFSRKYNWLEIKSNHNLFGTPKKVEVNIAYDKFNEIELLDKKFNDSLLNELNHNSLFKNFTKTLEDEVLNEFRKRAPGDY